MFEHLVLSFGTNDPQGMYLALNRYGSVGWEVVGITGVDRTVGTNGITVVMKRERPVMDPPDDKAPGWRADPWGRGQFRWWAGATWAEHVLDKPTDKPRVDWPTGEPLR